SFAYYNTEISDWYAESGDYGIQIGKSSRDIVLRDRVRVLATNEIPQVFSQYSTVGDILESPIGAGIIEEMLTKTPLAGTDLSAIGIENIMDLVKDIPIKALASFGGGMISAEMIDHMLIALNEKKK
ncbi:MAG: glycosyl hydrolase, partial [Oscillospiraceae bacterium]